jgi:hypothetical protein
VSSLALSVDGKRLFSGSEDRTIKVWDLEAGKEILTLRGHTGEVLSLPLSGYGKRLVSGSQDKTIPGPRAGADGGAAGPGIHQDRADPSAQRSARPRGYRAKVIASINGTEVLALLRLSPR